MVQAASEKVMLEASTVGPYWLEYLNSVAVHLGSETAMLVLAW